MQGGTCLEGGSYLLNYNGCAECGKKSLLEETDVQKEEDEDGEETITFKRQSVDMCCLDMHRTDLFTVNLAR